MSDKPKLFFDMGKLTPEREWPDEFLFRQNYCTCVHVKGECPECQRKQKLIDESPWTRKR